MYLKAIIAGTVAGFIGAMIWAAISYFAHFEIGWIAWIIGALVGIAVAVAGKDRTGLNTGIIAVVISVASICAGKYIAVQFTVQDVSKKLIATIEVTDDRAKAHMASSLVAESESQGNVIVWPEGMDKDNAVELSNYPKNIVTDVEARWSAMPVEDQTKYKDQLDKSVKAEFNAVLSHAARESFIESFGLFDIVFFALAVITAFKLGSGMQAGD